MRYENCFAIRRGGGGGLRMGFEGVYENGTRGSLQALLT